MELTNEQYQRLQAHIADKWKAPVACTVCKQNDWGVENHVYEMREFHGGGMVLGGQNNIIPIVPVTCKNCGNTVMFNPMIAGINLNQENNG